MTEAAVMKALYGGGLIALGVTLLLLMADMSRGAWLWTKAPKPLNRMSLQGHRIITFVTMLPAGMVALIMGGMAATGTEAPGWFLTTGSVASGTISLGFLTCNPLGAALDTSPNHHS